MNILMVDVTDISEVAIGDEIVLNGRQVEDEVQVEEFASRRGTITYEILARLLLSMPRAVV